MHKLTSKMDVKGS